MNRWLLSSSWGLPYSFTAIDSFHTQAAPSWLSWDQLDVSASSELLDCARTSLAARSYWRQGSESMNCTNRRPGSCLSPLYLTLVTSYWMGQRSLTCSSYPLDSYQGFHHLKKNQMKGQIAHHCQTHPTRSSSLPLHSSSYLSKELP